MPYQTVKAKNHTFVFAYDDVDPTLLHIFARHLCGPEDAIETFFNGQTIQNERFNRFETEGDTHIVYWFWIAKKSKS